MKALKTVILAMAASGILLAGGAQAENNLLGQLQQAANEGLNGLALVYSMYCQINSGLLM